MVTNFDPLRVPITGDESDLRRAMTKSKTMTSSFAREAAADLARVENRLDRMTRAAAPAVAALGRLKMAAAGIGGLAAGVGLTSFANAVKSVVSDVAKIADVSSKIGISAEAFQELTYAANQSGVEIGTLETSLEQFSRRIGEASTGSGELYDILKANGVAIRDANGNIRPLTDLLADFAELVRRAGSDQERLTLATAAFGRGGADMVNILRDGASGLEAFQRGARNAGTVIADDLVKAAAEFDDRWTEMTDRWEARWKSLVLTMLRAAEQVENRLREAGDKTSLGGRTGQLLAGGEEEIARELLRQGLAAGGDTSTWGGREEWLGADIRTNMGGGSNDDPTGAKGAAKDMMSLLPAVDSVRTGVDELNRSMEGSLQLAQSFASGLVSDLRSGVPAADALSSAFGRLGEQLIEMALNQAIISLFRMLMGVFGGGGVPVGGVSIASGAYSFGGGIPSFTYHRGGVAGRGPRRLVDPSVFDHAERYHGGGRVGLGPREVPAILEEGEVVLPRALVESNITGGRVDQTPVTVNIINNSSAEISKTETPQPGGGVRLDVVIDEVVAGKIGQRGSKTDRMLRAGRGVGNQLTVR